jgi:hypothetical protein
VVLTLATLISRSVDSIEYIVPCWLDDIDHWPLTPDDVAQYCGAGATDDALQQVSTLRPWYMLRWLYGSDKSSTASFSW